MGASSYHFDDETPLYVISIAAQLSGMHPQTLRKYERLGLIQPSRTLGSMRLYSRQELERLRMAATGLENLQANVFMCDRDLRIVYVNAIGMKTLRTLADEVRRAFGVDVNSLIGTSIHTFHKDPRRVERILQTGANDVLVVSGREGRQETLIPFIADVIKQVDLPTGRIVVDWGEDY